MEATEKAEQIQAVAESAIKEQTGDGDIFFPEPEIFVLGGRKYTLHSPKYKEQRLISRMRSIDITNLQAEDMDLPIDCISEILKEPDRDFIESNIDNALMYELFYKVSVLATKGIPMQGGNSGKGNGTRG